jgi:hypothetical protein
VRHLHILCEGQTAAQGACLTEGVPGGKQGRVLLVEFVLEPAEGTSAALACPLATLLEPLPEVVSRRRSAADEDFDSLVAQESGRLEIVLATWLSDLRQLIELGVLRPRPLLASKRPGQFVLVAEVPGEGASVVN